MATESVTKEAGLDAFACIDSSTYIAQAMAVADVMASGNNDQCDPRSLSNAGSLIYMLLSAATELDTAERDSLRERMSAAEAHV